jgi:hypothetical protein
MKAFSPRDHLPDPKNHLRDVDDESDDLNRGNHGNHGDGGNHVLAL